MATAPPWHRPLGSPQLGSRASSGCAWQLWLARRSHGRDRPTGRPATVPLVLEPAASKAADYTAFDHPGTTMDLPDGDTVSMG